LRLVVGNCSGSACDWFIPLSLLIPLLILVMVAITGIRATATAYRRKAHTGWALVLAALTVLGVIGPIVALAIFRDSPDRFIPVATLLVVLLPLAALAYDLIAARRT
jgi:uncharacterized membrane protein YoaK (UPF0700 family)